MNFRTAFEKGQSGSNVGLPMGEGLNAISTAIKGVQKAMIYTIAASPKGGKSTFVDNGWVIEPCIYVMVNNALFNSYIEQGLDADQIRKQYGILYIDLEIILTNQTKCKYNYY